MENQYTNKRVNRPSMDVSRQYLSPVAESSEKSHSSYSDASALSSTYGAGHVSAFSSLADLKAKLKRTEMLREERRRQLHNLGRDNVSFASGGQSLPHIIHSRSSSIGSPSREDMQVLGLREPGRTEVPVSSSIGSPSREDMQVLGLREPGRTEVPVVRKETDNKLELRDDAIAPDPGQDDRTQVSNDNFVNNEEGKLGRPSLISIAEGDDLSDTSTSQIFSFKRKNSSRNKIHKAGSFRKLAVGRPISRVAKKIWRKVKPIVKPLCGNFKLFRRKEHIDLERATGYLS